VLARTSHTAPGRNEWRQRRVALARTLVRRRRLITAVLLVIVAVDLGGALRPGRAAEASVVVVTHDLAAGHPIVRSDLAVRAVGAATLPDGTLTRVDEAVGTTLNASVRRGEILTDVRLSGGVGDRLAAGEVAAPVRLADGGLGSVLEVGQRVDIVATSPEGSSRTVASGVRVISVPATEAIDPMSGVLVVFAVPTAVAADVVGAGQHGALSVVLY